MKNSASRLGDFVSLQRGTTCKCRPRHPHTLLHRLLGSGLCEQFAESSLAFIDIIVGDESQWPSADLKKCLETIKGAESRLINDDRFKRLTAYLRRQGQD